MASNLSSNAPASAISAEARDRRSIAAPILASDSCHGPADFKRSATKPTSKSQGASKTVPFHIGGKENRSGNLKPLEIAKISKILDTEALKKELISKESRLTRQVQLMNDELNNIRQQSQRAIDDITLANEIARCYERNAKEWEEKAKEWEEKAKEWEEKAKGKENAKEWEEKPKGKENAESIHKVVSDFEKSVRTEFYKRISDLDKRMHQIQAYDGQLQTSHLLHEDRHKLHTTDACSTKGLKKREMLKKLEP
ncbi:hypothetical protein ACHAXS_002404 [Conticribra weissflogii]